MPIYISFQVEKVEEFEPGKTSYFNMLEKIKECQARVYFLYARYVQCPFFKKIYKSFGHVYCMPNTGTYFHPNLDRRILFPNIFKEALMFDLESLTWHTGANFHINSESA